VNERLGTGRAFIRQNREKVEIFLDEAWLDAKMPRTPAKIFVCDMTDLFADFVPDMWIDRILGVAERHPEHVYQLLTKRPERMQAFFAQHYPTPLANLWLGTSIGELRWLGRLEILRATPAAIRFVSFEPLLEDLGSFSLTGIHWASPVRRATRGGKRGQCTSTGFGIFAINA
jgi:protein gp37